MDVLMPQLGETVNEGTVAAWHKQVGEAVDKGELLLDVETDKVATEIIAPAAGVIGSINVPEGETVDVGTLLAVISVAGEAAAVSTENAAPAVAAAGSPPGEAAAGLPQKTAGNRLSPAVRRLLREHELDASDIVGTGKDGRLTRRDVLQHIGKGTAARPAVAAGGEKLPFNRIRKMTAEHMVRSKATSPHVLQVIEADFSSVDKVRLAKREQWRNDNGYSLTYMPFVARALCLAIAEFPRVNASIDGDSLQVHADVNLAIAVDLNFDGLVAPVIHGASSAGVPALAVKFNEASAKAKDGKLTADDLAGGTYTLSNPGPFGTLFTAPIINQPQVGILSMDAVTKRPVVVETTSGDSVAIRPVGVLAHSFDHRAIDGAYSAAFLNKLKSIIETTDWDQEF